MIDNDSNDEENYLKLLSRGGLITPSKNLATMVACLFAQIEYISSAIDSKNVRKFSQTALEKYAPEEEISCKIHREVHRSKVISIVTNCFYNNMQKLATDGVRKEAIADFKNVNVKRNNKAVQFYNICRFSCSIS